MLFTAQKIAFGSPGNTHRKWTLLWDIMRTLMLVTGWFRCKAATPPSIQCLNIKQEEEWNIISRKCESDHTTRHVCVLSHHNCNDMM